MIACARRNNRALPPSITTSPTGTAHENLADGHIIDKPSVRLVITYWPTPPTAADEEPQRPPDPRSPSPREQWT